MNLLKVLLLSVCLLSIEACVTTRAELNEKRGQGDESSAQDTSKNTSVKSEDLSPSSPSVVETSKPAVPTPDASATTVVPVAPTPSRPSPLVPLPVANSQYGMEEMRSELAKLSGKVEDMEQEKKTQDAAHVEEQNKLQAKITDLEKQLKEKEEQEKGPAVPEGKTPLQAGKDAYFASTYGIAIQYFDQFLKTTDNGKEAEEATFLRGESNFKLKEYKKAIVDYSKFPEKYMKSNYHPKALLKIAESFEALEMKEDAKAFYADLLDKFPKTVEGKIAKKRLSGKTSKK